MLYIATLVFNTLMSLVMWWAGLQDGGLAPAGVGLLTGWLALNLLTLGRTMWPALKRK
jgi:hypothetical protein